MEQAKVVTVTRITIEDRTFRRFGQSGPVLFEEFVLDNGRLLAGKHGTSSKFSVCQFCGAYESNLADHEERFHSDGKYEPSDEAREVAKRVAAGQVAEEIIAWLNRHGEDYLVFIDTFNESA